MVTFQFFTFIFSFLSFFKPFKSAVLSECYDLSLSKGDLPFLGTTLLNYKLPKHMFNYSATNLIQLIKF